jgi:hypothetical protein
VTVAYSAIAHVSPWDVTVPGDTPRGDVARQRARLEDEGQIEPIVVRRATGQPDPDEWPYAGAQVIAARELDWPTILVVYT